MVKDIYVKNDYSSSKNMGRVKFTDMRIITLFNQLIQVLITYSVDT